MSQAQTWCSLSTQEEVRECVGKRERNRASSKSIGQGAFVTSHFISQGGLLGLWGFGVLESREQPPGALRSLDLLNQCHRNSALSLTPDLGDGSL